MASLPIRVRIVAAFAVVMSGFLIAGSLLAYRSMGDALLDEIDTGLRFRAASAETSVGSGSAVRPDLRLQEPGESFFQLLGRHGTLERASAGFAAPVLTRDQLSGIRTPRFFERPVQGVAGRARLLAIPVANNNKAAVLVVGQTMSDRTDALRELLLELVIGGIAAIVAAGAAGWFVARWALRPVDRMRAEAAAITLSGMDHRLTPPRVRDELHRLAGTLNAMLGRLQSAIAPKGHSSRRPATNCGRLWRRCGPSWILRCAGRARERSCARRWSACPKRPIGWHGLRTTSCCWPGPPTDVCRSTVRTCR